MSHHMHQKPFERVLQSLINGVFGRNFYNGPQQKVIIVGIAVIALFYPSPSFLQHLYVHDYCFQIEQCCLIPCDGWLRDIFWKWYRWLHNQSGAGRWSGGAHSISSTYGQKWFIPAGAARICLKLPPTFLVRYGGGFFKIAVSPSLALSASDPFHEVLCTSYAAAHAM